MGRYNDYYAFLEDYKEDGWFIASIALSPNNRTIVQTYPVKKCIDDIFLKILCPQGRILAFPGIKDFDIDTKHFSEFPNLYKYPYFFNIRCFNESGVEPYWNNVITIQKIMPSTATIPITKEYYDDLSIKADTRIKRLAERYYPTKTIILFGEQTLSFSMKPDVDITKVELFVKADFFTKLC